MTDLRQAAQQALEALEELNGLDTETECVTIDVGDVIAALKAALEQQERKPLPEEEIVDIRRKTKPTHDRAWADTISFTRAIEAKLKERNT